MRNGDRLNFLRGHGLKLAQLSEKTAELATTPAT